MDLPQSLGELNERLQELAVEIANLNGAIEQMLEQVRRKQLGPEDSKSCWGTHWQARSRTK